MYTAVFLDYNENLRLLCNWMRFDILIYNRRIYDEVYSNISNGSEYELYHKTLQV